MGAVLLGTGTALAAPSMLAAVPSSAWFGGVIATVYILAVVVLVPRLGVGNVAVLIIAGQILGALVIDRLGAFGAAQAALSLPHAAGALAVVAGAALVRFG